jgi:hypothetical protein
MGSEDILELRIGEDGIMNLALEITEMESLSALISIIFTY